MDTAGGEGAGVMAAWASWALGCKGTILGHNLFLVPNTTRAGNARYAHVDV